MWRVLLQQNQTYRSFNARLGNHPAWVIRTVVSVTLLVIIIPMIIIILAALLVGGCLFLVLSLIARVLDLLGLSPRQSMAAMPEPELRRNVRVVEDE